MPADRLTSVFKMFSQVETALSRSRGGLGIGLSLTQRLVQMHGGTVEARSEGLGRGSEFEVRLPLASASSTEPDVAPVAVARANVEGAGLRILIADDNEDAAATMAVLLELMGHTVKHVNDGEAAVQATRDFAPQVVLLDIGMPKINGYEACRLIRVLPGGAAMTVIAVTGWGQPQDRRSSQDAGFDRHLVKPVDPDALADLLAAVRANGGARGPAALG